MPRRNPIQGEILASIIKKYNLSIVAEIGIWKGHTARTVLKARLKTLSLYWGIDSYNVLDEKYGLRSNSPVGALTMTQEDWDRMYIRECSDMLWFPEFRIIRTSSVKASELFPSNYFDLIFIDASHFYEDVIEDIRHWLPKVKKNGFLTGHDYNHKRFSGVTKAVNKYFGKNRIKVYDKGYVWQYRVE